MHDIRVEATSSFYWDLNVQLSTGERSKFGFWDCQAMIQILDANKLAKIHLYELGHLFNGVEFFDKLGRSLVRVSRTTGEYKVIKLEKDEKVIGLKCYTNGVQLYEV